MLENNSTQVPHASMSGYLSNGIRVFFTIPLGSLPPAAAYDFVLNYSQTLLSKGLLLNEPGLEAGEQAYSITHIVRGTQPAKDGKPATPIIFFYHDNLKWSDTKTWLNTPDDVAEFERWSGVKLDTMKSFPAGRLERSKDAQVDADYVVTLTPARRIVWKLNPDYVEGSKTESKREFARFDAITAPTPNDALNGGKTPQNTQEVAKTGIPEVTFDSIPSVNAPTPINPALLTWSDDAVTTAYPVWPTVKDKTISAAMGNFFEVLAALKLYGVPHNGHEMRNSLQKMVDSGELQYSRQTLSQGVVIVMNHRATKTKPANETKLSTDDLQGSMERAKAAGE